MRESYGTTREAVVNLETSLEIRKGELASLEVTADPNDDAALDRIGRLYTALRLIPARIQTAVQAQEAAKQAFIEGTNSFISGPLREKLTTVRAAAHKKVHATLSAVISDPQALDMAISRSSLYSDLEVMDRTIKCATNPFDSFVHCQTALDAMKRLVEIEKNL